MIHNYVTDDEIEHLTKIHIVKRCLDCENMRLKMNDEKHNCQILGSQQENIICDGYIERRIK